MSLWCSECAGRVRQRKGCPKHPMAVVDRVPPLDGFVWFGVLEGELPFNRGRGGSASERPDFAYLSFLGQFIRAPKGL